jgi:hypothetical protein
MTTSSTSSGTALRRLQQSDARDHHHAECANGFHVFNVRLNVASGKFDDQSSATCTFQHVLSEMCLFLAAAPLTPFRPGLRLDLERNYKMKKLFSVVFLCFAVTVWAAEKSASDWAMNASIIEACSCPMFCQCYFNTSPAGHSGHGDHSGGEHFCRFNNAYKINHGHAGQVKLDGAKFWVAGDLGSDFSQGKMDWAVLTFDPAVKPDQREAIKTILGHVYPVKWNSFTVASDSPMEWKAAKEKAEARLDGGKTAEVVLNKFAGMTSEPVVMKNLKYWGVPRNDGFIMMPNEVQAYRAGDKPFEFKGTNGFMITLDINSRDVAAADAKAKAKM